MTKPIKPNITIPEAFAVNGQKADFLDEKIQNGFSNVDPDVLAGDNLNKLIDDTYKGLNYSMDGVSDLYKSVITYDSAETYGLNSIVFNIEEEGVALYQSLIADNTGNPLTDETKWQRLELNDYSEIIQALQNKMDKDMSNSTQPYVTETYVNGTSGYRVWSDGYCIQWGYSGWTLNPSSTTSISLFKNFSNTDYYITIGTDRAATGSSQIEMASIYSKSTGSFVIGSQQYVASEAVAGCWLAMGYLALGQY